MNKVRITCNESQSMKRSCRFLGRYLFNYDICFIPQKCELRIAIISIYTCFCVTSSRIVIYGGSSLPLCQFLTHRPTIYGQFCPH